MFAKFDLQALQATVDAACRARGLSWAAAAREVGVSASTLRGLSTRRAVEGDGVLQILRWLGRSPESFIVNRAPADDARTALPAPAGAVLRFDARALYHALDVRRVHRGMTWPEVAAAIGGTTPAALLRLQRGGRVSFPPVMRLCAWLGEPAAVFVRVRPR